MLEVRGLIKRYNRIPAVDGVSFSIRPGEILGYVGPNGAGKSTTVKVLTGLIEPTEGESFFQGHNVRTDPMLRLFSLWEDRPSPLSSYSKGMRQQLLTSGALLHPPQLMILDEPFS